MASQPNTSAAGPSQGASAPLGGSAVHAVTSVGANKVAAVTGGSAGIGKVICEQLLEQGYEVISLSRRSADIQHPKTSRVQKLPELQRVTGIRIYRSGPQVLAVQPEEGAPRLYRPHRIVYQYRRTAGNPPVSHVDIHRIATAGDRGPLGEIELQRLFPPRRPTWFAPTVIPRSPSTGETRPERAHNRDGYRNISTVCAQARRCRCCPAVRPGGCAGSGCQHRCTLVRNRTAVRAVFRCRVASVRRAARFRGADACLGTESLRR